MKKLVIFNLATDPDHKLLGASLDWIEAFRDHFVVTDVVSTHVGKNVQLGNIKIRELGGGSLRLRIVALFRLLLFALDLISRRKDYLVFHHMSPRTAVFPGILFKIFGIPQALWYSHSSKPISLKISLRIVDNIFSSENHSFPYVTKNLHLVGHGISLKRFDTNAQSNKRLKSVLFVGRISKIKNLDKLINQISLLNGKLPIILFGPIPSKDYLQEIENLASNRNVELEVHDPINYVNVGPVMAQYQYFYAGMANSVDKSALEAAISGCFVLTTDKGTQELSGMNRIWEQLNVKESLSIKEQIEILESLEEGNLITLRELSRNWSIHKNGLSSTIAEISTIMKKKI